MAAVFLSYAHQDADKVGLLREDLFELAGPVWLDKSLIGGQVWWNEILAQIRECRLFVLAVSNHSLRSEACMSELGYAHALARPLLAVRLDNVDIVIAPDILRRTQMLSYETRDADATRGLAKALFAAEAPGPLPSVLPNPPDIPRSYRERYAAIFGQDLPMDEQVAVVAKLKHDLDQSTNQEEARELLRVLHDRDDLSWKVREEIDSVLRARGTDPSLISDVQSPRPFDRNVASGWYADPSRRFESRYWDGTGWTEHVATRGRTSMDPAGQTESADRGNDPATAVPSSTATLRIHRSKNALVGIGIRYGVWINDERMKQTLGNDEWVECQIPPGTYNIAVRRVGVFSIANQAPAAIQVNVVAGRTTRVIFAVESSSTSFVQNDVPPA